MNLGYDGKVALVVGGSEGMGLASARSIGREGATVVIIGRSEERLTTAAASLAADGVTAQTEIADAENADSIDAGIARVLDRNGRVDVLVNAVGGWESAESALDFTDESWHYHLDTVVLSAARTCRAVMPGMAQRGSGSVVNIAAQSSERHWSVIAAYSAMKAAMVHLTKNLAREFGPSGVRVNAVRPGWIMSESQRRRFSSRVPRGTTDEQMYAGIAAEWPELCWANRFGTVEEIGEVVAFLASDLASYVNGALWSVDGGSPV